MKTTKLPGKFASGRKYSSDLSCEEPLVNHTMQYHQKESSPQGLGHELQAPQRVGHRDAARPEARERVACSTIAGTNTLHVKAALLIMQNFP